MRKSFGILINIFGIIYGLLNFAAFAVFFNLILFVWVKSRVVSGIEMLLPPLLGIIAGYWIFFKKFNVWRVILICISIVITALFLFLAFNVSSKLAIH